MQPLIPLMSIMACNQIIYNLNIQAMKFKSDPLLKLFLGLLFILLLNACKKEEIDTIAPGQVTDLLATASDGQVVLVWTEPTDQDLHEIEVAYSPGSGITLTQRQNSGWSYLNQHFAELV